MVNGGSIEGKERANIVLPLPGGPHISMLNHIQAVTESLKGAGPDDFTSERKWLKQRVDRCNTVSKKRRNNKAT
jgi:hypothetical protein